MATIFVQIAAYRDPETQHTIKDMFEQAAEPDRVFAGICWQVKRTEDQNCFEVPSPRPEQTREVFFEPLESKGVCWARAECQKLYRNEDYVLMIDSHMRFEPGWDRMLIDELAQCSSAKSFLSCYPPGYEPPRTLSEHTMPRVMRAKPFSDTGEIRFDGEVLRRIPEKPLRGAFLAAGFMFAPGQFIREVPYDPHMYFDQEEVTLATRAFTHGWDVFSAVRVFVYHYYYKPQEGHIRHMHWSDCPAWSDYSLRSRARMNYLLRGTVPDPTLNALQEIEAYGLGSERSLGEFEEFSGLNFAQNAASEKALRSGFIDDLDFYRRAETVD